MRASQATKPGPASTSATVPGSATGAKRGLTPSDESLRRKLLLSQVGIQGNAANIKQAHESDEEPAARLLLTWAQAGEAVVLPVDTAAVRERLLALLAG